LPISASSFSTVRCSMFLALPLFLFPGGFHSSACRVISLLGPCHVCPIHFHFLILIVFSVVSWFVISHSLSLLILFGHHIFIILCKHLFTKTCNFCINFLFIFHVSDPYNSTDLTLELKILIL
jgi:hypothetical protein